MRDLVKRQSVRVEAFQDFYRGSKSYTKFDHDAHLQEFIEQKDQEEIQKKVAVERNAALFRESIPKNKQPNDKNSSVILASSIVSNS